jgi:Tfp pilus assembly protein FimV
MEVERALSEVELLRRLDQMAMEIEALRQKVLEMIASRKRTRKFKSVREYEACGMWADRPEWEGMTTEEIVEWIRERAWRGVYPHFSMIEGLRLEKPY